VCSWHEQLLHVIGVGPQLSIITIRLIFLVQLDFFVILERTTENY